MLVNGGVHNRPYSHWIALKPASRFAIEKIFPGLLCRRGDDDNLQYFLKNWILYRLQKKEDNRVQFT